MPAHPSSQQLLAGRESSLSALESRRGYELAKRGFDVVASAAGLVLLTPLFLAIAGAIKAGSKGPVFFKARRVAREGLGFDLLKFRSMVVDADKLGGSSTPEDDPRITRAGKFLRRYKLDELPQLWNVFVGEMSFVGPRPQVQWAVDLYSAEQRRVLSVRPGITDYASLRFSNEAEILRGSKDPDADYMEKIHAEKMRLSLEYVGSRSFAGDMSIIARTLASVIKPLGN